MAEDKKSVLVYAEWMGLFEALEDDEAGRLIKHFFRYVNDLHPTPPDRITEISFILIEKTLKRDLKKWDVKVNKRSKAGMAGAEARWQTMANDGKGINDVAKMAVNVNVNVNVNVIFNKYNEICKNLPKVLKLSESRKRQIKARLKENNVETILKVFENANESDFLNGKNDRNWTATFDWLMNPTNFVKVLENQYINKIKKSQMDLKVMDKMKQYES